MMNILLLTWETQMMLFRCKHFLLLASLPFKTTSISFLVKLEAIREDILINPEEDEGYALVYSQSNTLPGSSGGAVVDEDGFLVAINGAKRERDPHYR